MRLTKSFHRKGYNITRDNFFTTVKVAGLLQEKGTTLVGTVRANVKGIPKETTKGGNEKFSSKFFFNADKKWMLVNYQCKQKKNVHLMSTMHDSPATNTTEKEITCYYFYNHNNVGVDVFDQMVRLYTSHAATRRWPMAVWTNLWDMEDLNSWIFCSKATGSRINRRAFILQLDLWRADRCLWIKQ